MPEKKSKIGFVSLGCPKNQIDTEIMLHELMSQGYEITGEEIEADIIIINTCAFIESAKQESIDNILDIAWLKSNGKHRLKGLIVAGCLAERYREDIISEMPEVDAVIGVGSIHDIVEAVEAIEAGRNDYHSFKPAEELELGGDRVVTTPFYTAYLKIAEGCDNRCAYCAIPSIRGCFRSRPIESIVEEAVTLEQLGAREIILVAQDTTRYGLDIYGDYKLAELIHAITDAVNVPWIRLLYCYPDKITDELVNEIANNKQVVKYIDLPIQHISDSVLTRMNRHGGSEIIRDAVRRLREAVPDIIIRTTAIVGFPGETDEDFTELCEYVKEAEFDRFGAFTYSREEGTAAYDFDDQIDEQEKQDRYDRLMEIQYDITEALNQKYIGKTIDVLCEGYDVVAESYYGRSYADAPDIDGKVYFTRNGSKGERIADGSFVKVKITDVVDYDLMGECKNVKAEPAK